MTPHSAHNSANFWDIITAISSAIMALLAFFAIISYYAGKKTNYLSTIESCSEEFRRYMRSIQKGNPDKTIKRDILGLFHKQLFYIKHDYVPRNIKIEWIKTMYHVLHNNTLHMKMGFKEEFGPSDWQESFDRVRLFMSWDKNSGKDEIKVISKHFRKNYFNCLEKIRLSANTEWKNAFKTENIN